MSDQGKEVKVYYFNRCREIQIEVDTEDGLEPRDCFLASRTPIDEDSKPIIKKKDHDRVVAELKAENKMLAEALNKFITKSNGISVYVRNEFNEEKLKPDDLSDLVNKIWSLYNHQIDSEKTLKKLGVKDE